MLRGKYVKKMLAVLIMISASACVSSPDLCSQIRQITPTTSDVTVMSIDLARQILDHNDIVKNACGKRL